MASLKKRGKTYYAQYYVEIRQKRICLEPNPLQIAKENLRQLESAQACGTELPFPTKTPIGKAVEAYVQHMRLIKTARSATRDISYLREAFGPVCPSLAIKS